MKIKFTFVIVVITFFILGNLSYPAMASPIYVTSIGEFGSDPGQFGGQSDIVFIGDRIYVSDGGNDRIQIFDKSFNFISSIGSSGSGAGQFDYTFFMDFNETHIAVSDYFNNRVQFFDHSGSFVDSIGGTFGTGSDEFYYVADVELSSGRIYVADEINGRIQVFNQSGSQFLQYIGNVGLGYINLEQPTSIEEYRDTLYVVDFGNYSVKMYNKFTGRFLGHFGGIGYNPGQFREPVDIHIQNQILIVADRFNRRIQFFDLNGNFIDSLVGSFERPNGISANATHLFISDIDAAAVVIYQLVPTPISLSARSSRSAITLSWDVKDDFGISEVENFNIYRKSDSMSNYEFLVKTTDQFYQDFSIQADVEYSYKVQAVSKLGMSSNSSVMSATSETLDVVTTTIIETEGGGDEGDEGFVGSLSLNPTFFVFPLIILIIFRLVKRNKDLEKIISNN